MKFIPLIILFSMAAMAASYNIFNQPVLIDSTLKVGSKTANTTAAQFEVVTTAKGSIACPKMTTTQRNAISSPVEGLCVYNTTTHELNFYKASAWDTTSPLTTKGDLHTYSTLNDRLAVGNNGYILSANSATSTGLEWITQPIISPLSAKGDIYTFSTVNARLPIGTNGKILQAASGETTGLLWADYSPLTTKGDLYVYSTVNTRLPIGTAGYVLTADPSATPGVKWAAAAGGALSVTGSRGSPSLITAAGGIAFTGTVARQMWIIAGNGGPIDITANPQIAAATDVGQELILFGTDDTNFVTVEDGTGLSMDGPYDLTNDKVIGFVWDGTNWIEIFRR